ncbi:DUF4199 domain-containing protein [Mucilaginibacter auburnensis]|uniref:Uncharacterized protein DUF4199 n=1 Tax=Mucilaginibacter auburnensis TaxID=1457233 RepID=A0A2H9VLR5_9SPHI|nr:DUF4199 domain-containing protein [Mucilaginibacter auburnensis]PJJ79289.1 uncharacterized protein DUF4199 [Mucilaginibacter auburnensis]
MENQAAVTPNPTKVATKWALISTLTNIVLTYVFEFMNLDQQSPIKYLSFLPFIIFLFLAQKEFRDTTGGGYMTFGTGFSTGFRYSVFTGLLLGVFIAIYLWILSPEVLEKSLEASRAQMEARGMSDAEIERSMGIANKIGPWAGGFFSALMYTIVGALLSLIGAAIFKKERSPLDTAVDPE